MPRAAVTWVDDDRIRVAPLAEQDANVVGRAPGSAVHLAEHDTVSRQHAVLRLGEGAFVIEHLSRTNPTLVNGALVQGQQPLADGDTIEVGPIRLAFHDLSDAGGGSGGATCHYCNRRNPPDRFECWHCGSSLVNAVTVIGGGGIGIRLVDAAGARTDLALGQHLQFDNAGAVQPVRGLVSADGAAIESDGSRIIARPSPQVAIEINGQPLTAPRPLATGDLVRAAGVTYACILRT